VGGEASRERDIPVIFARGRVRRKAKFLATTPAGRRRWASMRFRTVLFDLDGTLIEHLPAIHRCYAHTLPKLGLPAPTYEQVKSAIGGGLSRAMRKFVPAERVEEALAIYRPYWDETMLDDVALMPGGREILESLREAGAVASVFTNKMGSSARLICDHLGVSDLLADVVGADDTQWLKPELAFTEWALARLGVRAGEACMVGDSPFDVAAAVNSGMGFVGVTTGTHSESDLRAAGATEVWADLPMVAAKWNR